MNAIGPTTDFTLETNRKKVKEKLLKTIQNPVFYLLDLEFQTIKIQTFLAMLVALHFIPVIKSVGGRSFGLQTSSVAWSLQACFNSKECFGFPES